MEKQWQFIVYETDDTTVDFTITNSELVKAPTIPSPRPKVTEGKIENVSFQIEVGDFNGFISQKLDDADNRMDLHGRWVEAQIDSGSGFVSVWQGRWAGAFEDSGPGKFSIRLANEHWKTRNAEIFGTSDTLVLQPNYPFGLKDRWGAGPVGFSKAVKARALVEAVDDTPGTAYVKLSVGASPIPTKVKEFIVQDVKADAIYTGGLSSGNFNSLRIDITGDTIREIIGFSTYSPALIDSPRLEYILDSLYEDDTTSWPLFVWVKWGTGTFPSVDDEFEIQFVFDGIPTSEATPFHIGGADGVDPIAYLKTLYDNAGIRYESATFSQYDASTNPNGLIGHPRSKKMWWRITEAHRLGPWSEANIYKVLGLVPFLNDNGEIAPRFVFLPQDVDPTTLTSITASNTAKDGHPTWGHEGSQAITEIVVVPQLPQRDPAHLNQGEKDFEAVDRIVTQENALPPFTHDKESVVGSSTHEIPMTGVWVKQGAKNFAEPLVQELFDRFGDGPQVGKFKGLSSLDSIQVGDFVSIEIDTFPNAVQASGRGGTRVVQIIGKQWTPAGPDFEFLDAGPSEQPLATPTVSIVQGDDPQTQVQVSISGLDADAVNWSLQLKIGSDDWTAYGTNEVATTSVQIGGLPEGETIQARAFVSAPSRIRSSYSTVDSVTLASLTAPSGLSATVSGRSITLTWTNGESDKPVMPVFLEGTSGTPEDFLAEPLPFGTTEFTFSSLKASTQFTIGVYHLSRETGGESAQTTITATTSTENTLNAPTRLVILQGRNTNTGTDLPPEEVSVGEGFEISWRSGQPYAATVIQAATDSGFTNIAYENVAPAGTLKWMLKGLDLGTTYFIRIKHQRVGFTDSSWSSTVSAQATRLLPEGSEEDFFAAGSARLYIESGVLKVYIDSNDRDTDRVYFEAVKNPGVNPYPTVDETDNEVTRANLPYDNDALDSGGSQITMTNGDEAYVTVRFYNDVAGFGGAVRDTISVPAEADIGPQGDVSPSFETNADLTAIAVGNANVASWKIAGALNTPPSDAAVRGETAINGQSLDKATVGVLASAATPGDVGYVAAFAYDATGGGGTESDRIEAMVIFGIDGGIAIVADSITANELAADSVEAHHVVISSKGASLNRDPLVTDLSAWAIDHSSTPLLANDPASQWSIVTGLTGAPLGTQALQFSDSSTDDDAWWDTQKIPVDSNRTYRVSVWVRQTSGTGNNYLAVTFFDDAGNLINNSSSPVSDATGWSIGTHHYWEVINASFPSSWTRYTHRFGPGGDATIPTGAVGMKIGALVGRDAAATIQFQEYRLEELVPGELIVDGTITGDNINATFNISGKSITADTGTIGGWSLSASSLSSNNVTLSAANEQLLFNVTGPDPATDGTGIFVGLDGADYEIRAGSSTNYFWWDGTNLTLRGGIIEDIQSGSDLGLQGWSHDMSFSASDNNTVAWTSGTIEFQSGETYSITGSNTGNMAAVTYIYLDSAASTTALQTTTTGNVAVGTNRILVAVAGPSGEAGKDAEFIVYGGGANVGVTKLITAVNIAAGTITADEIDANTITAAEIDGGTITGTEINATFNISTKDFTADTGTIAGWSLASGSMSANSMVLDSTNGRIRIGATGFDPSTGGTGIIMGRDSAGVYDFRVGDSSNYIWWDDSANTLTVAGTLSGADGTFAGGINVGSTNQIWLNDGGDGVLAVGGSTKASAPFRVTAGGDLTAESATITGTIEAGSTIATGSFTATSPVFDNTVQVNAGQADQRILLTADTGHGDIQVMNSSGNLRGRMFATTNDNNVFANSGDLVLQGNQQVRIISANNSIDLDSDTHITLTSGVNGGSVFDITLAANRHVIIPLASLPTSDPNVAGALFREPGATADHIVVSAG